MATLTGHTSPETAYVVNDYPYGFRLRCKIRYWLEYKAKHGFRFVSQTTNPKRAGEFWNKPKASTYCDLAVMVQAEDTGYISWAGTSMYDFEKFQAFVENHKHGFDTNQEKVAAAMLTAFERYNARKLAAAQNTPAVS
jgi:hypothetical protein